MAMLHNSILLRLYSWEVCKCTFPNSNRHKGAPSSEFKKHQSIVSYSQLCLNMSCGLAQKVVIGQDSAIEGQSSYSFRRGLFSAVGSSLCTHTQRKPLLPGENSFLGTPTQLLCTPPLQGENTENPQGCSQGQNTQRKLSFCKASRIKQI